MLTVFIVGPYRGDNHDQVRGNIERAARVARCCWQNSLAAVCPHLNTAWFSGIVDEEVFLVGYREILRRCDAVLTVPGWEDSTGSHCEIETAKSHGVPIFHELIELLSWAQPTKKQELQSSE